MKGTLKLPRLNLLDIMGFSARELSLIRRGLNPFEMSYTRVYSPLKIRRKRVRNPQAKRAGKKLK